MFPIRYLQNLIFFISTEHRKKDVSCVKYLEKNMNFHKKYNCNNSAVIH